jgi:hypothetical protein
LSPRFGVSCVDSFLTTCATPSRTAVAAAVEETQLLYADSQVLGLLENVVLAIDVNVMDF